MNYLLDTNAFSDLMRQHPLVTARLASLAPADRAMICPVVRGEIRYGLDRLAPSKRRQDLEREMIRVLGMIPCQPLPCAAGDIYARIRLDCERRGLAVDENDLWIAAAALQSGTIVVSRDTDFQHVSGLAVEDWSR